MRIGPRTCPECGSINVIKDKNPKTREKYLLCLKCAWSKTLFKPPSKD